MSTAGIARVIMVPIQGNIDRSTDLASHPTISGWINTGLAARAHISPVQVFHSGMAELQIEVVIITTVAGDTIITASLATLATALGVSLETWSYAVTYG